MSSSAMTLKLKRLIVGAVNPRLSQFTAALALAVCIGAVVGASVIAITVSITSECQQTCSGLPLDVAAQEGGTCKSVYLEEDLTRMPKLPAVVFKGPALSRVFNIDFLQYRDGYALELVAVNGTFTKDFDFGNLKCAVPTPEKLTRAAWSMYIATRGYKAPAPPGDMGNYWKNDGPPTTFAYTAEGHGTIGVKKDWTVPNEAQCPAAASSSDMKTESGDPVVSFTNECPPTTKQVCNKYNTGQKGTSGHSKCEFGLNYVHWMHVDALSSTRLQIGNWWDSTLETGEIHHVGSLSCCHSSSGSQRLDVSTSPNSPETAKEWYEEQLEAERENMACVHFDIKTRADAKILRIDEDAGKHDWASVVDNTDESSDSSFFGSKSWSSLQEATNNLTSSSELFKMRMNYLQQRTYSYCCKDVCPSLTAALGSALGYANYIEVVITVIAIFAYMRFFGGTMTDAGSNDDKKPMTFQEMMNIAKEEDEKKLPAAGAWQNEQNSKSEP